MSFKIFKKERNGVNTYYSRTNEGFSLAGNKSGLLHALWNKKKPVEPGWSITADELLKEHCSEYGTDGCALVTIFYDFGESIGLAEIEAVHVYTEEATKDYWSVVMLELRQIHNGEFEGSKEEFQKKFLPSNDARVVEFLYLRDGDWNWGRNGNANGAFIYDKARKYFQNVFNK